MGVHQMFGRSGLANKNTEVWFQQDNKDLAQLEKKNGAKKYRDSGKNYTRSGSHHRDKYRRDRSYSPRSRSRSRSYSRSPRRKHSYRDYSRDKESSKRGYELIVEDLPSDVERSEVKDMFRRYGYDYVEMPKDRDERGVGYAFVGFESRRYAERAKAGLDRTYFDGRKIRVKYS
eukprot:TRINITY_DN8681_c0_g1_i3.p2 TRINITY_DN8681_c0_g1~~TRINITY_DN8681_c0_g1_i3.p2  ORF type:complete len:174 (+),score=4.49 TRINITY_DN8681_c0_g1_i3:410-931(+)